MPISGVLFAAGTGLFIGQTVYDYRDDIKQGAKQAGSSINSGLETLGASAKHIKDDLHEEFHVQVDTVQNRVTHMYDKVHNTAENVLESTVAKADTIRSSVDERFQQASSALSNVWDRWS
jgi:ElaB/YqjD/DUF883 family membrane-anchored ribosome-binding protein